MRMSIHGGANRAIVTKRMLVKPNVKISYPFVSGLPNPQAERNINDQIMDGVYHLVRMQGYLSKDITEMVGEYEVKLNDHGLLSVVLSNYAYWKHAAHGMTYQLSYTFDLNTGSTIPLAALFKQGVNYQKRLSAIIKRQIKERDIQLINDFDSIVPDQSYYLTENELVLYFQIYEYTPYYYGFPEFPIPYKEIADIIAKNGPLHFTV